MLWFVRCRRLLFDGCLLLVVVELWFAVVAVCCLVLVVVVCCLPFVVDVRCCLLFVFVANVC